MPLNLPTFFRRLGSSVVFVAIMLTGLLWNEWSFLALVCLINFLCLREYFRLVQQVDKTAYWPKWIPAAIQSLSLLLVLIFVYSKYSVTDDMGYRPYYNTFDLKSAEYTIDSIFGILIVALLPIVFAVMLLAGVLSKKTAFSAMVQSLGGLLYITLPMIFLLELQNVNKYIPIVIIVMIWSNDTMAYLVGSFTGKHPLSVISPKKTWEGTIGGIIVTVAAAGITGYLLYKPDNNNGSFALSAMGWVKLALCVTIAGTFGDLLESKLKRIAEVKDSGSMMPGHGGALDRFDSLLIATPFAFAYIMFFAH